MRRLRFLAVVPDSIELLARLRCWRLPQLVRGLLGLDLRQGLLGRARRVVRDFSLALAFLFVQRLYRVQVLEEHCQRLPVGEQHAPSTGGC